MTGAVTVRAMTQEEYDTWIAHQADAHAEDLARASGGSLDDARDRARRQLAELLPDGLSTPGTWCLRVLDPAGDPVGALWIGPHPQRSDAGWVYEIEIDEPRRGEGLGRAAMVAAEQLAREAGWTALGLNVFGHNPTARRLYESLGYEVVSTSMSKPLG